MGWTEYHASHYKNGKVDRKAECNAYFLEGLNEGFFDVLKSSMVGSTYYAAVKPLKKSGGKDENGNYTAMISSFVPPKYSITLYKPCALFTPAETISIDLPFIRKLNLSP